MSMMIVDGFNYSLFTKTSISHLALLLVLHCERMDTNYRLAIIVRVCVACAVYKLVQGVTLLHYLELFAIGKSTNANVVRDVVLAINVELRQKKLSYR